MAVVARKNGRSSTALATVVLALSQLLLATHSDACGGYTPCPKPPPSPAPCPPTPRAPTSGGAGRCPVNTLKLGACASVLGGLLSLDLGQQAGSSASSSSPAAQPCCQLLDGLADLDAAVCLCTALRANVLGLVQLSVPVELSVLVNYCGKKVPQGFQCSS